MNTKFLEVQKYVWGNAFHFCCAGDHLDPDQFLVSLCQTLGACINLQTLNFYNFVLVSQKYGYLQYSTTYLNVFCATDDYIYSMSLRCQMNYGHHKDLRWKLTHLLHDVSVCDRNRLIRSTIHPLCSVSRIDFSICRHFHDKKNLPNLRNLPPSYKEDCITYVH